MLVPSGPVLPTRDKLESILTYDVLHVIAFILLSYFKCRIVEDCGSQLDTARFLNVTFLNRHVTALQADVKTINKSVLLDQDQRLLDE
jgi:hypothetical protein